MALPCTILEWDTDFFGLRIATLPPGPLTETSLSRIVEWCRAERVACLYALSSTDDPTSVRLLEDAGGRVVDVRMTFARELPGSPPRAKVPARGSLVSDIPALRELARASHTSSRFWADLNFPRERCAELYATWIEKSCRGWADQVFVAEVDGQPAGYLSCHLRADGRGEIGIVAVAPAAQGRGLGGSLLDTALSWFAEKGCRHITVVTQGRNASAQRLYQSRGFLTANVQVWHHLWFTPDEARP